MVVHNFIDLFAGAGGLSCGLEMTSFHSVLANEMVDLYAQSYKINHPDANVISGDIRQIETETFLSAVKDCGDIDLIAGGPPCQGFSINAPSRSMDDQRNHLFEEYLRVVSAVKPKAVLIENVPGIVSMNNGSVVNDICSILRTMGYKVDYRILFAGHYGVPQMRFRTVFIAIKDYSGDIVFPTPRFNSSSHANFTGSRNLCLQLPDDGELVPETTIWNAIGDLPEIPNGNKCGDFAYDRPPISSFQEYARAGSSHLTSHFCNKLSKVNIERMSYVPVGGSWRDIPHDLLPQGLKRARRSDHTRRYGRLDPNEIGTTIMTKCDPHWGTFVHPYQDRVISVREAARIQSFPDSYQFLGSMTQQYEQVGNAVPPLMAKAIGSSILEMIDDA